MTNTPMTARDRYMVTKWLKTLRTTAWDIFIKCPVEKFNTTPCLYAALSDTGPVITTNPSTGTMVDIETWLKEAAKHFLDYEVWWVRQKIDDEFVYIHSFYPPAFKYVMDRREMES